jgi:RNA polymerase sigma-70 factor (ECF subfamily)
MEFARKQMADEIPSRDADAALTRRAARGNEEAQKSLVFRVAGRVNRTCRYLAGDNDASDLAQMAVIQVLRSAGSFRGDCSLDYWVDRVTVRTLAKQFEKRSRRTGLWQTYVEPDPEQIDVEHQAALGQVRCRLAHHFSKISAKQRGAVVLHYLYGYEIAEIADLLGARINAIRSRLRKGLKQLRRSVYTDPCLREWVREGRR